MTARAGPPLRGGDDADRDVSWVDHTGPTAVATTQQVGHLNQHGFFVLERAFHPDTMAEVTAALTLDRGLAPAADISAPTEPPAEILRRFCSHPLLAGLARDFVGPDASVGADGAIVLPARDLGHPPFRQDVTEAARPAQFITCWIVLTEAGDGRCLQVASGRHRAGLLRYDLTGSGPDPHVDIDPRSIVDLDVGAGSVVVMSSLTPRRVRPGSVEPPLDDDHDGLLYAIQYVRDVIELDNVSHQRNRRRLPVVRGGQLVGPT